MTELKSESPVPLWYQIYEVLAERIRGGETNVLLSDSALSSEFKVSRMTVRQAVQRLVDQGLVKRIRGRGTVVLTPPIAGQLSEIERFFEEWRLQGRQFEVELVSRRQLRASGEVAEALGVEVGEYVEVLERRRTVDDRPIVFDVRFLTVPLARALTDQQLRSESIWIVLEEQLGIPILCAETELRAVAAPLNVTSALGLRAGTPVLDRKVRILDEDKQPVIVGHSFYDSSRFVYCVTVNAHRGSAGTLRHARETADLTRFI